MVPLLWTPFMGSSLVYMILYVWSREFPYVPINIYGVSLKVHLLKFNFLSIFVLVLKDFVTCEICSVLTDVFLGTQAIIFFFFLTGVLSSLGNTSTGSDFWESIKARDSRDCGRTSLLLLNSSSSTCRWTVHLQDSSMGVSFYCFMHQNYFQT